MAKIFVLEDDKDIREIVEWILMEEHFEVESFANVHDFTARDMNVLPDLFILDVMLPDGSGLDVCNVLKSKDVHKNTPVIIMSAHASLEQVSAGCKADGFIHKPFNVNYLLEKIQVLLKN
jgi:DNA-binding response OmpR family regulator